MKKFMNVFVSVVAILCVLPYAVHATSLVENTWHPEGGYFARQLNGGTVKNVRIGEFTTQIRGNDGNLVNSGEWFHALCVEPGVLAQSGGELVVQVVRPGDKNGGLQAAWLLDTYYRVNMSFGELAGLQIAMWEAVTDFDNYSLSQGDMRILGGDSIAIACANSYLKSLPSSFDEEYLNSRYFIAHNPYKQDLMLRTNVPEPSTVLLLGAGLLGIGSITRRKRRK